MKLTSKVLLLLALVLPLSSCKTQLMMSNGAFSDISLNKGSDEYSLKRLAEINTEGKAVFGIPVQKSDSKKQGIVFRFNGINLSDSKGFFPVMTMIGLSLTTGYLINDIIGYRKETVEGYSYKITTDKYLLGFGSTQRYIPVITGSILAIPISGAINNFIWSGSAYKRAAFNANSKLLLDNPEIDVFLNPKYEIETKNGLWSQKAKFKVKVMGATIAVD